MKVLIACEESGTVRDAFIDKGHDAISCDILPSRNPGPHYQGPLEDFIGSGSEWDLIIAHPPCTYLTGAAEWAFADTPMIKGKPRNIKPGTLIGQARKEAREHALHFVQMILNRDCKRICLENPVGIIGTRIRPADQWLHPYQFGHDASKATGLWLKGLEPLKDSKYIFPRGVCGCGYVIPWEDFDALGIWGCPNCCGDCGPAKSRWGNQTDSGQNKLPPSKNRAQLRSKTYQGIAKAMAEQW